MRGYRRHRKQSRWGFAAFFCPPLALVWGAFWFLMMSRIDPDPLLPKTSNELATMWSIGGCLILGFLGVGLSLIGLLDRRTRHHTASIGLAVNLILLLVVGILILVDVY